jgi:starch phosphorylase
MNISIAYFSMEIGLESAISTYSGGLGVLAGDTLRSAADAGIAMAGITLLSRKGYFLQRLDPDGNQTEEPVHWPVHDYLTPTHAQAVVEIEDRTVQVRAWRYDIPSSASEEHTVPVFLLDTDIEGNSDFDRSLTDVLYGGDEYYRLCQEVVLGIGGVRILRALGCASIERYHMNEGHSALLVLELLNEIIQKRGDEVTTAEHIEQVRRQCVFTTHTPVKAGRDQFPLEMARRILQQYKPLRDCSQEFCYDSVLNLTHMAMETSYYINGVAKKHREISRKMFEGYHIDFITNGVHAYTWASDWMRALFDKHIPDWHNDNASLRYAISIDCSEIQEAHRQARHALINYVNKICNAGMDHEVMTIGFARRATRYKRANLIFSDIERLRAITKHSGQLQLVFAGKAHPADIPGKELIREVFAHAKQLRDDICIAWLPDYDMDIGRMMTSGVDLWLNTPQPPLEASGTSGMKAAINGVPSLSVPDGWWLEGCIEGVTGWSIADPQTPTVSADNEADILYSKLENIIVPMFYNNPGAWLEIMRHSIAINGSFFNTERMLSQYVTKAYFR